MANEEWLNEPDFEEWVDEATGLTCFIKRNELMGNLCGYVIAPPGSEFDGDLNDLVKVHGGITYKEDHLPMRTAKSKITVPPGSIIIGFDCSHIYDITPYLKIYYKYLDDASYKNWAYVKSECTSLARQVKDLIKGVGGNNDGD